MSASARLGPAAVPLENEFLLNDRHYTHEEWLAMGRQLDTKFEYLNGALLDIRAMNGGSSANGTAMAGGTTAHGNAVGNVFGSIRGALRARGSACYTRSSEIKIDVERFERYYYPDASVRCGDEIAGRYAGSYSNPTVVVEVVSTSSYARDLGSKFKHYRSLRSLRDYVCVFLTEPMVYVFSRGAYNEIMTFHPYYEPTDEVAIPSLGVSVAMAQFYEEVDFPPQAVVVDLSGDE